MQYKFIEIGSCDFNTQIDTLLQNNIGICVDPIKYYLDNLPNLDNLIKENSAISNEQTIIDVFYIPDTIIQQYFLPGWLRGCNKIGAPHPTAQKVLKERNLSENLIHSEKINCITYKDLVTKYSAYNIEYLKIDTEGHEPTIIDSIYGFYSTDQSTFTPPNVINFEAFIGQLVTQENVDIAIDKLKLLGYKLLKIVEPDIYMTLI